MTYAAVVVSYNRIALLKECLEALHEQTRPLDEIIVVDNGSTDGSADYVASRYPDVVLYRSEKNLGGAGGFAWGVDIAMARSHRAVWLMDDDARPERDAFAPLVAAFEEMESAPGFLASVVVVERDVPNFGNSPHVSTDMRLQFAAHRRGGIAADAATFVGVLINLEIAALTHLPLDDYFIWLDDTEYTRRLSSLGPSMYVTASMINHPEKSGEQDMGWRLFYFLRNRTWQIRETTAPWYMKTMWFVGALGVGFSQWRAAASKRTWISGMTRGPWQGLRRTPTHRKPGELIATLSADTRAQLLS